MKQTLYKAAETGHGKTYMSDRFFFDTNLLVYAFDPAAPEKQAIARELFHTHGSQGTLCLSTQVLQEFYVATTRARRQLLTPAAAIEIVDDLAQYPLVTIVPQLIKQAMQRHQNQVFSFWDSLIVEAALAANCSKLLSEDMQHGLVIDEVMTIENPLRY